jgi:hypothetical protein
MPRPPHVIRFARLVVEGAFAIVAIIVACAVIGATSLLEIG